MSDNLQISGGGGGPGDSHSQVRHRDWRNPKMILCALVEVLQGRAAFGCGCPRLSGGAEGGNGPNGPIGTDSTGLSVIRNRFLSCFDF